VITSSHQAVEVDAAFSSFYRAELDGQVRRAWLMIGDNEAANDVVHDAMVAVYKRWSTLDKPGAYLNQSVLNGCRDSGRRRASRGRLLQRLPLETASVEHDPLVDVLSKLPFNHRAAIVLRYYASFSTDEIAVALSCAPGSVGPWIDRGLAAMRKELS
jgi:RNA polymerase sigma factor (sigma-70 family)